MTSKERVRMALAHEMPDRVPIYADCTPEVELRLRRDLGFAESEKMRAATHGTDFGVALGNDLVMTNHGMVNSFYLNPKEDYVCEWGIRWHWVDYDGGAYTENVYHPLADESAIDAYQIPDPSVEWRYDGARELIGRYGKDYWVVGHIPLTIFEAAFHLRGLDLILEDMVQRRDVATAIMDKVMQYPLVAGKKLIELGVDMLWTGDDVAMQTGMMMSPAIWREVLKPRMAYLFQEFKRANPNIKIAYHSDGDCSPIIPDLIEIGLDVLNPVQPKCIDPAEVKRLYGDRLCFWGSIDEQETLPFGTPEDVRAEVRLRFDTIGQGGGFILSPSHNFQVDTSTANILAFFDEAKRYCVYGAGVRS